MKISVGQKIRKIRQAKEFTQDNMAFELGITKSAYSKIEREESNISIKRLEEIAKVLEVDIVEFFKDSKSIYGVEDPPKNYGFATKGDIEELVKMIQDMAKEINSLKSSLNTQKATVKKSKARK